nr:hypothetical protein OG781_40460 [Streptomyces sp. NBC_00830]
MDALRDASEALGDLRICWAAIGDSFLLVAGKSSLAVLDRLGEHGGAVSEVPQQLPGLLGGPGGGGVGAAVEDVRGASSNRFDTGLDTHTVS